jgi:hypothetical protein
MKNVIIHILAALGLWYVVGCVCALILPADLESGNLTWKVAPWVWLALVFTYLGYVLFVYVRFRRRLRSGQSPNPEAAGQDVSAPEGRD